MLHPSNNGVLTTTIAIYPSDDPLYTNACGIQPSALSPCRDAQVSPVVPRQEREQALPATAVNPPSVHDTLHDTKIPDVTEEDIDHISHEPVHLPQEVEGATSSPYTQLHSNEPEGVNGCVMPPQPDIGHDIPVYVIPTTQSTGPSPLEKRALRVKQRMARKRSRA